MSNQAQGARTHKPYPKPPPAYLPTASSVLSVDKGLYDSIQTQPRVLLEEFTLPIRSGRAWEVEAGCVVRISTPEGAQVGDLNVWNRHNPRERFWAARTKQLYASHLSTHDRLFSTLPYLRPLATILHDSLAWYGADARGGRVHDLLGTRCDPYVNAALSAGARYDFHCHSNLARAAARFGLVEADVHDVLNLFQVTGLDERGRYWMGPSPAEAGDCVEFLAEQDLLMALSTCPGGDLSAWGFGEDNEQEMIKCCRPLHVAVFKLEDESFLKTNGWKPAEPAPYSGAHGVFSPEGEHEARKLA